MIMAVFRFRLLKEEQIFNRKAFIMMNRESITVRTNIKEKTVTCLLLRLQHPWYKQLCSQSHSLHTPQSPPPTRLLQRSIQGWEGLEVKETSVSVGKRRPLLKADQASAHKYSVFFKIWWYTCSSVWVSAMLRQVVLSGGSAMLKTTLPWVHANFTRELCVCFHIEAYREMIDIFSGTIP